MIIANHASYMDIFDAYIIKETFVFVGKKSLEIPIFGYIYRRAAILVDRSDLKVGIFTKKLIKF